MSNLEIVNKLNYIAYLLYSKTEHLAFERLLEAESFQMSFVTLAQIFLDILDLMIRYISSLQSLN